MVVLIIKNQCLICSYKNQHICNFGRCKFSLTVDILQEMSVLSISFVQLCLLHFAGHIKSNVFTLNLIFPPDLVLAVFTGNLVSESVGRFKSNPGVSTVISLSCQIKSNATVKFGLVSLLSGS